MRQQSIFHNHILSYWVQFLGLSLSDRECADSPELMSSPLILIFVFSFGVLWFYTVFIRSVTFYSACSHLPPTHAMLLAEYNVTERMITVKTVRKLSPLPPTHATVCLIVLSPKCNKIHRVIYTRQRCTQPSINLVGCCLRRLQRWPRHAS